MAKRLVSIWLCVAMLLSVLPIGCLTASAAIGGDGTKESPYRVTSGEQLKELLMREEDMYIVLDSKISYTTTDYTAFSIYSFVSIDLDGHPLTVDAGTVGFDVALGGTLVLTGYGEYSFKGANYDTYAVYGRGGTIVVDGNVQFVTHGYTQYAIYAMRDYETKIDSEVYLNGGVYNMQVRTTGYAEIRGGTYEKTVQVGSYDGWGYNEVWGITTTKIYGGFFNDGICNFGRAVIYGGYFSRFQTQYLASTVIDKNSMAYNLATGKIVKSMPDGKPVCVYDPTFLLQTPVCIVDNADEEETLPFYAHTVGMDDEWQCQPNQLPYMLWEEGFEQEVSIAVHGIDGVLYDQTQTIDRHLSSPTLSMNLKAYPCGEYSVEESIRILKDGKEVFTYTDRFTVYIVEPYVVDIEITRSSANMAHKTGEYFDRSRVDVTAHYSDYSSRVLEDDEYAVEYENGTALSAGDEYVTIVYEDRGFYFRTRQSVTVADSLYAIKLSTPQNIDFGMAPVGYTSGNMLTSDTVQAINIRATNTGSSNISLNWKISDPSLFQHVTVMTYDPFEDIEPDSTQSLSIAPKQGLPKGEYKASIRLWNTDAGIDQTIYLQFKVDTPMFITQPVGGNADARTEHKTVSWEVNFEPVKACLVTRDIHGQLVIKAVANGENSFRASTNAGIEQVIRVYYTDSAYIQSDPFVITPWYEVFYTADSEVKLGGTVSVDIERTVEQDEGWMSAYFDDAITYQWYHNGEPINGETGDSHLFTVGDLGKDVYVILTRTTDGAIMRSDAVTVDSIVTMQMGDVNQDGDVNTLDVLALFDGVSGVTTLSAAQSAVADVDGDGSITTLDVVALFNLVAGIE